MVHGRRNWGGDLLGRSHAGLQPVDVWRTLKIPSHAPGDSMPRTSTIGSFATLLDRSSRPVYAIDAERRIVYCNRALANWLALDREQIVGRLVEYHSAPAATESASARPDSAAPLTDLCPSPRALTGQACRGTIACQAPDGHLRHRQAEFLPLGSMPGSREIGCEQRTPVASGILVLLAERDLLPQELAAQLSDDPTADELHRTIRQFRRTQSRAYAIETLLGASPAMVKVRAQVAAAAASGANALICGRRGSGRGHVARTIHYLGSGDADARLVPLDCRVLNEELLQRAVDGLRGRTQPDRQRPTLLLENLEQLSAGCQSQMLTLLRQASLPVRLVATFDHKHRQPPLEPPADSDRSSPVWRQVNDAMGLEGLPSPQPSPKGRGSDSLVPKGRGSDSLVPKGRGSDLTGLAVTVGHGGPSESGHVDASLIAALSTITIDVPRLTERIEDLPLLAQCLLEECNRESPRQVGSLRRDALDLLALHSWPREIDELREVISAAHRACSSHEITPAELPAVIRHAGQAATHMRRPLERIQLDEFLAGIEKEVLVRALGQARGNKSEAAELLGITRPRLYRRMLQLGLISEPAAGELAQPEFIERNDAEDSP